MKPGIRFCFLPFLCAFFLISCVKKRNQVEKAFYYWKSDAYYLDGAELAQLKNLQTQKLYVKFFEVEKNSIFGAAPIAKTQLQIEDFSKSYNYQGDSILRKVMAHLEVVPTVFIKTDVFYGATNGLLDTLADNINFLISKYFKEKMPAYDSAFREIQIDCDWTAKTKDNYFYLLKAVKKISHKKLSCTLRLYPYKYPDIMGTPPVDKVTLMCYNLTSPLENADKNSILDNKELESYLKNAKKYPLHLDIALPLFSWMQVYQNNAFAGIIDAGSLDMNTDLKLTKPMWYEMKQEKTVGNLFLREGDKIKLEEVTAETLHQTIALIEKYVEPDSTTTITLFHLDDDNLKKHTHDTLNSFYNIFTK